MKLALDALAAQLAQELLPAYLISGDEPLLLEEAADAVRARARALGFTEREVFFIERASSVWEGVQQSARARSLFAARRIIEIRLPSGRPGTVGAAGLLRLLEAAGDELLMLVITDELEREAQGSEWVRALQSRGAWVAVRPVDRARLPQWLRARFRAVGLDADDEAVALLAVRCEGNLLAARQEVDKLALLLPRGARVGVAEVVAGSADSARFDVFQLGEVVRAAEPARALRVLSGLCAEGAEPVLVLWSLVRELHGAQGAGRRLPFARLAARASRADRMAKGLLEGEVWDELALLAVELTGRRTLPLLRSA